MAEETKAAASPTPAGQVRVLVVGDHGVGKTSVVHLIASGRAIAKPPRTVGCSVSVKYLEPAEGGELRASGGRQGGPLPGAKPGGYFVELWDVSGHDLHRASRPIFYSQINGVIFVYDLSRGGSAQASLRTWAAELARLGTFSAPSRPARDGALPVPLLVVANKADVPEKDPLVKRKLRLLDAASRHLAASRGLEAARAWAARHRLLAGSPEKLPEFLKRPPPPEGLIATAREGRLDVEAVDAFFQQLVKRRYFTEDVRSLSLPPSPWAGQVAALQKQYSLEGLPLSLLDASPERLPPAHGAGPSSSSTPPDDLLLNPLASFASSSPDHPLSQSDPNGTADIFAPDLAPIPKTAAAASSTIPTLPPPARHPDPRLRYTHQQTSAGPQSPYMTNDPPPANGVSSYDSRPEYQSDVIGTNTTRGLKSPTKSAAVSRFASRGLQPAAV